MDPPSSPFQAVADPVRREILEALAEREQTVTELAEPFEVSRSRVSQHLRILREAGLVESRRAGRRRIYLLTPEPLAEVVDWVARFDAFWDDRLARLRTLLEEGGSEPAADPDAPSPFPPPGTVP